MRKKRDKISNINIKAERKNVVTSKLINLLNSFSVSSSVKQLNLLKYGGIRNILDKTSTLALIRN